MPVVVRRPAAIFDIIGIAGAIKLGASAPRRDDLDQKPFLSFPARREIGIPGAHAGLTKSRARGNGGFLSFLLRCPGERSVFFPPLVKGGFGGVGTQAPELGLFLLGGTKQ